MIKIIKKLKNKLLCNINIIKKEYEQENEEGFTNNNLLKIENPYIP